VILLDTNIVSEFMKPQPHPSVIDWLDEQVSETLFLSSVTIAELHFGVAALPDSKRKVRIGAAVDRLMKAYRGRVLPFDVEAAKQYAQLAMTAKKKGRGFPMPDAFIAAIAAVQGFTVATRDTAPFEAAGLDVINPWAKG